MKGTSGVLSQELKLRTYHNLNLRLDVYIKIYANLVILLYLGSPFTWDKTFSSYLVLYFV